MHPIARFPAALLSTIPAFIAASPATAQCLVETRRPVTTGLSLTYGASIAADRDLVVVGEGSPFGRTAGTVYERAAGGWDLVEVLDVGPSNGSSGTSVGLSGSTVMISNPGDGGDVGSVKVFERTSSGFVLQQVLHPSVATPGQFGRRIVLRGDRVVVAAPLDSTLANRAGAVYVFERQQGSWVETARVDPPSPHPFGFFGIGLDLDADTLAVGQPGLVTNGTQAFETWIFRASNGAWQPEDAVAPMSRGFGYAVALEGDRLAIGSYQEFIPLAERGAVFLHRRGGTNWRFDGRFSNRTLGMDGIVSALGQTVEFSGGRLLVGGGSAELSGGGGVVVLEDAGDGFEVVVALPPPVQPSAFGAALELTGDDLWIGAPEQPDPGVPVGGRIGAHYVYDVAAQLGGFCFPPVAASSGRRARLSARGCPELASNALRVEGAGLPADAIARVAIADATAALPGAFGGSGTFCLAGAIGRFPLSQASAEGTLSFGLDLLALPGPTGPFAAMTGETWFLQCAFRDGASSGTTNALELTVR